MNLCFIIATFWPSWGGAERQCQLLARAMTRRGHAVTILTRGRPGLSGADCVDGVAVRRTKALGKGTLRSLIWTITAATWLRRHGRRFDVLQCYQLLSPSHVGLLGRSRAGKQPVVLRPACSGAYGDVAEIRRVPLTRFRVHLLRQANACVVLTKDIETEMAECGLGAIPVHRIPNAVDLSVFRTAATGERRALRTRLGLPQDGVVCLFVGRLVPQKDPELLLDAWSRVHRRDAHLVLVGDGPLRPHLEARIAADSCAGRVTLVGATEDTASYLRAADCFALPSRAEGMSNAILEAMATGLAVVATDVGAAGEVLGNGYAGLLTPPGDAAGLAEQLNTLLDDGALRSALGTRAGDRVRRYGQDRVTEEYLALYERLRV